VVPYVLCVRVSESYRKQSPIQASFLGHRTRYVNSLTSRCSWEYQGEFGRVSFPSDRSILVIQA
jgi:hypothetical protein